MILCKFFTHAPTFDLYKLKETVSDEAISEISRESSHSKEDFWDFFTIIYKEDEKIDD